MAYGTVSLTLGPLTRDRAASLWAMRRWCQISARGLDSRSTPAASRTCPTGPFVYCANHQSLLDILVLGRGFAGRFQVGGEALAHEDPVPRAGTSGSPVTSRWIASAGSRTAAEVIGRFEEVLKEGKPLLVFPEGTRSEDGIVRPFKNGGFYAAVRAGVPVVPVALEGTHQLMKKGAIETGDGTMRRVRVAIGEPLHARTEGRESARVNELRDRTHAAVVELHRAAGGFVPDAADIPPLPTPAQPPRLRGASADD